MPISISEYITNNYTQILNVFLSIIGKIYVIHMKSDSNVSNYYNVFLQTLYPNIIYHKNCKITKLVEFT